MFGHHTDTITTAQLSIKTLFSGILIGFAAWLESLNNVHLPPIFLEMAQVFSYAAAGAVSGVTVYKFFKSNKKREP